jgi:phage terminase large subunit
MIFKVNENLFRANTEEGVRTYVNQGGTSSGKTYTIMQVLFYYAIKEPYSVTTVVGQDFPNLKVGAYRDAQTIMSQSKDLKEFFTLNKGAHTLTGINGSIIEFNSYQDEQDAKNGKRDRLFVNEANGISYEIYWQLTIRTRKQIWIDYNPSARFWAHSEVIGRKGVKLIISDHRDNAFLSQEEHERIEGIEDPELFKVYARGKTGKLSGLVFPNYDIVDSMPGRVDVKIHGYGLDFGFTNDPTALIEVSLAHGDLWLNQILYSTGMTNPMIATAAKDSGITRKDMIVADSAEPKSIAEIRNEGLYVVPTVKGADSISCRYRYTASIQATRHTSLNWLDRGTE